MTSPQPDEALADAQVTRAPASYHHGDLRATLLRKAVEVVRRGGPAALSMRDLTRAVGVSVNAAYRHFADRDDLLLAVTLHCQAACAGTIETRQEAITSRTGSSLLRAVGLGYIEFARTEPGLFEAAFLVPVDLERSSDPRAAGPRGQTPFQLLSSALDAMLAAGDLSPRQRELAEVPCWSAVHGFAMLAVRGPLREFSDDDLGSLAEQVVDGVIGSLALR